MPAMKTLALVWKLYSASPESLPVTLSLYTYRDISSRARQFCVVAAATLPHTNRLTFIFF
jgi:hypothetical protein